MHHRQDGKQFTGQRNSKAGYMLLGVVISMSVLLVVMASISSAYISYMRLQQLNDERDLARNAAEQILSTLRSMPGITNAYQRFGGGGPEETFHIPGLQGSSSKEPVGRIIVWRQKNSLKNHLNPPKPDPGSALDLSLGDVLEAQGEFLNHLSFVMDRGSQKSKAGTDYIDTNSDGVINGKDRPQLMPVTISIRWNSGSGITTEYFSAVIGRR